MNISKKFHQTKLLLVAVILISSLTILLLFQNFTNTDPGKSAGRVSFADGGRILNKNLMMGTIIEPLGVFSDVSPNAEINQIINNPNVIPKSATHVQIYLTWADLEPAPDNFNFQKLHDFINKVKSVGKKVVLRLDCGMGDPFKDYKNDQDKAVQAIGYPNWLIDQYPTTMNVKISDAVTKLSEKKRLITYKSNGERVEIDYEDENFQQHLQDFISKLAGEFDGDPGIDYIDLRVIGRFGEWGGWTNADNFEFKNQRATLESILNIYMDAFKITYIALPVAGRKFLENDNLNNKQDYAEDVIDNWAYDKIWKQHYPNLIFRTDTVQSNDDFLGKKIDGDPTRPGYYNPNWSFTGWFFERGTTKSMTSFESVTTCMGFQQMVANTPRYVDNVLYRIRSNFAACNNVGLADWNRYEKVYNQDLIRMRRQIGYRVRPAQVQYKVVSQNNTKFLIVDHTWVNSGFGKVPNGYYPVLTLIDGNTKQFIMGNIVKFNFADLSTIRNTDFIELRSIIRLPQNISPKFILSLGAKNPDTGDKIEMPVSGSNKDQLLEVAMVNLDNPESITGMREDLTYLHHLLRSSHVFEAESAWKFSSEETQKPTPSEKNIGRTYFSPNTEALDNCLNCTVEFKDINAIESGIYELQIDLKAAGTQNIDVSIGNEYKGTITVPINQSTTFSPIIRTRMSSGKRDIRLVFKNSTSASSINRLIIKKISPFAPRLVDLSKYPINSWTPALSYTQSSTEVKKLKDMSWWDDINNDDYDGDDLDYKGFLTTKWEKALFNEESSLYTSSVESDSSTNTIRKIQSGDWIGFSSILTKGSGSYNVVMEAKITSPATVNITIDGTYIINGIELLPNGSNTYQYFILAQNFKLPDGLHDVKIEFQKAEDLVEIKSFSFNEQNLDSVDMKIAKKIGLIKSSSTGLVLDTQYVAGPNRFIVLGKVNNSLTQAWELVPAISNKTNEYFQIRSLFSGLCLTIPAQISTAEIVTTKCGEAGSINQYFSISNSTIGSKIVSYQSGKCLATKTRLIHTDCSGEVEQAFVLP